MARLAGSETRERKTFFKLDKLTFFFCCQVKWDSQNLYNIFETDENELQNSFHSVNVSHLQKIEVIESQLMQFIGYESISVEFC